MSSAIRFELIRGKNFTRLRTNLSLRNNNTDTQDRESAGDRDSVGSSGLGQEFVLIDHGRDGHLSVRRAAIHAHDLAFAVDTNAFGQRDFGR